MPTKVIDNFNYFEKTELILINNDLLVRLYMKSKNINLK